jgi:hypothetical protein
MTMLSVCLCFLTTNYWIAGLIFMKLCKSILAFDPYNQSLNLYVYAPKAAR